MNNITIICGNKHSGKTTMLQNLILDLQSEGKTCSGIIAIGTFKNNQRYSFDIVDISTQKKIEFMSINKSLGKEKIGKFYINPLGFEFGIETLEKAIKSASEIITIDEIGQLELNNKGWSAILKKILKTDKKIIFTVRKTKLQEIIKKFKITEYKLIEV